jgi:dTDP-4-amino-4,6-dideoxygalactose transaminase
MNWQVPLADLDYGQEEETAVLEVLRSRWLTTGAITQNFEKEFSALTGSQHAIAVSNGTAALHLACEVLGIGPGDEVIVPALTFVATANAVLYTGAKVRFAEITSDTNFNISPQSIESQITSATKAIVVVHYGGNPCQMDVICDLAKKYNLAIIEDAAHAPGASLHNKALGTWGDIGCFSFFSNKNLAVGEGGMIISNRDDLASKIRVIRSHGMTSLTWDRHKGHAFSYDVTDLGYNYRIDEIRSALGLVQLRKLIANNHRRAKITQKYWHHLNNTDLILPFQDFVGTPSYHIFPILLPAGTDRKSFMKFMQSKGIQTSIHYPPIHKFSYYQKNFQDVSLPLTEEISQREVTLPLYPKMTNEQVDLVISNVKLALEKAA